MLIVLVLLLIILGIVGSLLLFWRCQRAARKRSNSIAFYHPFCSSGGGGERVLWKTIEVLSRFEVQVVIYTVDAETTTYRAGACCCCYRMTGLLFNYDGIVIERTTV